MVDCIYHLLYTCIDLITFLFFKPFWKAWFFGSWVKKQRDVGPFMSLLFEINNNCLASELNTQSVHISYETRVIFNLFWRKKDSYALLQFQSLVKMVVYSTKNLDYFCHNFVYFWLLQNYWQISTKFTNKQSILWKSLKIMTMPLSKGRWLEKNYTYSVCF